MAKKLSRDRIVEEAMALLQEQGFERVSVNELARRLDVGVASLYWHVANKAELHRLMTERIYSICMASVPDAIGWQEWLTNLGLALWKTQSSVRDARLLIMTVHVSPEVRRSADSWIVEQLVARGLAHDVASAAQHSVQALVTGWTALQMDNHLSAPANQEFRSALEHLVIGWRNGAS